MGAIRQKIYLSRSLTILLTAAAAVIIVTGMREAAGLLANILLAVVITMALAPIPHRLARKGVPLWLGLILTLLLAVIALVSLALLLAAALISFADAIPQYTDQMTGLLVDIEHTAERFGIDPSTVDLTRIISPAQIASFAANFVAGLLSSLSSASVVLLLVFFMLIDALGFGERFTAALADRPEPHSAWLMFAHDTRRYLLITTWTGLGVGAVNTVLLLAIGVDYALLWGVFAFLLSFVPNIGFMISLIPPAALALLEFGVPQSLIVIVGYILINAMVDNVIKPKLIGDDLDLSLATTFISLVFWGWVLGPLGAILAIPLTLLVKLVLLGAGEESRFLADLMGSKLPAALEDELTGDDGSTPADDTGSKDTLGDPETVG